MKTVKKTPAPFPKNYENHSQNIDDLHSQINKDGRERPLNLLAFKKQKCMLALNRTI